MSDENVTLTPTFIVYINGTRLGVDHEASVRQILIKDQFDAPSTCKIILSDLEQKWVDSADFDLAQSVSVQLGFKDAVTEVFNGEIIGSEVVLKKNADTTFVINCSNKMHRLYKVKKHRVFNEMTDADIITEIASDYGFSTETDELSAEHIVRIQEGVSDYDFIRQIALLYSCKFWIKEDCLYLKAETEESDEDIVLEWGKTLLDFNGVRNTDKLLTQIEVTGWDDMTGEGFSGIAEPTSVTQKVGDGDLGLTVVSDNFGDRRLVLGDANVADQQSAEAKATAILTSNSYEFMTAQATCEGDNRIKSGAIIEIKEVGDRFSGPYLVRRAVHNFHASTGYRTNCDLERNGDV
jgi:phage protein D